MRLLLCLVVLACGCQSSPPGSKALTNAEFLKKFSAGAPEPVATNAPVAQIAGPKLIAPGMVLTVTVAEDANWNRQYMVPSSGAVEILGLGRLSVTGLTADELAQKIKQPLEKDYLQKATVTVTIENVASGAAPAMTGGVGGGVVYVLGNIGRPGPLMLPRDEVFTLAKVIIAAGGIAPFGNGAKVRVLRYDSNGQKFETTVNVDRIMKRGEFEKDIPIVNGDWIIVPEKWINF
jgi:protein involved in polysaccharide export with SLBB domain